MALFDWNAAIQSISDEWRASKGAGVKIAILDSGADLSHPALQHLDVAGRKFDVTKDDFDPTDLTGQDEVKDDFNQDNPHGTKMASIIAAKIDDQNQEQLQGVAPEAEVFLIKIAGFAKEMTLDRFLTGLELAIQLDVDVISVSVIPSDNSTPDAQRVESIFSQIKTNNILLCATLRNTRKRLSRFNNPQFLPAVRAESIQVGMLYTQLLNQEGPNIDLSETIEFLLSQFGVTFCERQAEQPYKKGETSCSIATACLAGLFALMLSHQRSADDTFHRLSRTDAVQALSTARQAFDFDAFKASKSVQFFAPK